jgi:hypothetical protein
LAKIRSDVLPVMVVKRRLRSLSAVVARSSAAVRSMTRASSSA